MSIVKIVVELGILAAIVNLIIEGIAWSSVLLLIIALCIYWGVQVGEKDA